jgi:hypothetical protein
MWIYFMGGMHIANMEIQGDIFKLNNKLFMGSPPISYYLLENTNYDYLLKSVPLN